MGRILKFITFQQNALHLTRVHYATFYQTSLHHFWPECIAPRTTQRSNALLRACIVRCSGSEFFCSKFSTARLEVLPNLRHAGDFQMSTMVNFGIGFQDGLWLVQAVKTWREGEHLLFDSTTRGIYKFQLARRWCESKKMSCHDFLFFKNLYEPKMDVILIEITVKHIFCVLLCRPGRLSAFCKA